MASEASRVRAGGKSSGRVQCWVESAILAVGSPLAIWGVSRLISFSVPAASHGSPEQRFLIWTAEGALVLWPFVIVLWLVLRSRGFSFSDLGVWRLGTWPAWVVALLITGLSVSSNLRFLPRMHIPISYAFFPPGLHLPAALVIGITGGFCEEVLFRAFLMTEFAKAGYSKAAQVVIPGFAFGLSHAGYLNQGFLPWLGLMLPTAFIGMVWGIAYLLGRRSLVPAIVAHFLNSATAVPWILFFMVTAH
jgi:membrane protease YdiL (CAAX protease family)